MALIVPAVAAAQNPYFYLRRTTYDAEARYALEAMTKA
jgi:hypothetical protein